MQYVSTIELHTNLLRLQVCQCLTLLFSRSKAIAPVSEGLSNSNLKFMKFLYKKNNRSINFS
jgi:hypothetical protein